MSIYTFTPWIAFVSLHQVFVHVCACSTWFGSISCIILPSIYLSSLYLCQIWFLPHGAHHSMGSLNGGENLRSRKTKDLDYVVVHMMHPPKVCSCDLLYCCRIHSILWKKVYFVSPWYWNVSNIESGVLSEILKLYWGFQLNEPTCHIAPSAPKFPFIFPCFWEALKCHMWHLWHHLRKPVVSLKAMEMSQNYIKLVYCKCITCYHLNFSFGTQSIVFLTFNVNCSL